MQQQPIEQDGNMSEETLRLFAEMDINPEMDYADHHKFRLPVQIMRESDEENAYVEMMIARRPDILDDTPTASLNESAERKMLWAQYLKTNQELRHRVAMHFRIEYVNGQVARDRNFNVRASQNAQQLETDLLCNSCPEEKLLRLKRHFLPNATVGIGSPPAEIVKTRVRPSNGNNIEDQTTPGPAAKKSRDDVKRRLFL